MTPPARRLRYRPADWPCAAAAFCLLPLAALAVRVAPGRVLRWAQRPRRVRLQPEGAKRLVALVDAAAGWQPLGRGCLPTAVTTVLLGKATGVSVQLTIGARRRGCALDAHAWIEAEGGPITSHDLTAYTVVWPRPIGGEGVTRA